MDKVIEINEEGALYLPPELLGELLGEAKPHTQYALNAQDGSIILTRLEQGQEQPFWATARPEERAKAYIEWAMSHKDGPNLPDEALRRENMYD